MSLAIDNAGSVTTITMDDGKANVLSPDALATLIDALSDCEADDRVAAVVLAGRAGIFSGGFDLAVMSGGDPAAIGQMVSAGGELVVKLYGLTKPVVAACTGHAIAAGALTLLGCDVRVGPTDTVKIGLNEVANGMILPSWAFTIAAWRLSKRHVDHAVANARIYDAPGALDAGFLDELAGDVVGAAQERAEQLAGLDPAAYRGTIEELRGDLLARMRGQITEDRSRIPH
jgi:enoyl-CoA hydratase